MKEYLPFSRRFRTLCIEVRVLMTVLSNLEREAALKDSAFWWVAYLTYILIINLIGLAWHMVWYIQ